MTLAPVLQGKWGQAKAKWVVVGFSWTNDTIHSSRCFASSIYVFSIPNKLTSYSPPNIFDVYLI